MASRALAAEGSGRITGRVTDASTEAPIVGVEVCALSKAGEPGEAGEETFSIGGCESTGASGEYTISNLTGGEYLVAFGLSFTSKLNYIPQFYNDKSTASEAQTVSVASGGTTSGIDAKLEEGGQISGEVTDAASGTGISGVSVCAIEANPEVGGCVQTDASGEYTISGLAGGEYKVEFLQLGYITQYYNDKPAPSEANAVSVVVGKTIAGIDATLQPEPPAPPVDKTPPTVIAEPAMGASPAEGGLLGTFFGEGPTPSAPTVGSTLLCFRGVWAGVPKPTFSYRWLRDGAAITGAAEAKYVVQAADAGHTLACEVTAKNTSGEKSAVSAGVAIAGGSGGAGSTGASNSIGSSTHFTIASTRLVVSRGRLVRIEIKCSGGPCHGSVELTKEVVRRHRKGKMVVMRIEETLLMAKGSFSLAGGKSGTITLHLTETGRKLLANAQRHPLRAQLVLSPAGGKASTEQVRVS